MSYKFSHFQTKSKEVAEWLAKEFSGLRSGRAAPAVLDAVFVEAYGAQTPLKHTASISVEDARTLRITPYDVGLTKEIERAIEQSDIGIHPVVAGKIIRLTVPQMTEDNRKQLTKTVGKKAEDAHVSLRQVREDIKKDIERMEESGEIAEDARYRLQEELDELAKEYNDKVDAMEAEKNIQIMEV